MYLEWFNGWQQLDLDTNLDKSTNLSIFKKNQTLWPIDHQPVYTAKMQEEHGCSWLTLVKSKSMYKHNKGKQKMIPF